MLALSLPPSALSVVMSSLKSSLISAPGTTWERSTCGKVRKKPPWLNLYGWYLYPLPAWAARCQLSAPPPAQLEAANTSWPSLITKDHPTLANASLVGANTVKGPSPARVSTRPAATTRSTSAVAPGDVSCERGTGQSRQKWGTRASQLLSYIASLGWTQDTGQ